MECRAHNAEKESELLQEQLDDLKEQLSEVCISYLPLPLGDQLICSVKNLLI